MNSIPPPPPIGGRPNERDQEAESPYVPPSPPPVSPLLPKAQTPPPSPPPPPALSQVGVQHPGSRSNIGGSPVPANTSNAGLVSLILGIFGIFGITAIIGLVFGFIALAKAKKNSDKGKTLAITALLLNALWLLLLTVFGLVGGS